jgi:hypothetical protein
MKRANTRIQYIHAAGAMRGFLREGLAERCACYLFCAITHRLVGKRRRGASGGEERESFAGVDLGCESRGEGQEIELRGGQMDTDRPSRLRARRQNA